MFTKKTSLNPINGMLFLGLFTLFACSEQGNNQSVTGKKKAIPKEKDLPSPSKKKEFDLLSFLVQEESKNGKGAKIDDKNHSVSFKNDDDPYEVSFSRISAEDLNRDGVTDYIVWRNSEGMLGGNANTNSSILYIVMGKDHTIAQKHEILTYAPFSYNILDDVDYKNGKLKAKATQNFRTYMPEDGGELESTDLSFVYKNDNVYEESYLTDCELAKWKNKQLFIGNSEVSRSIDMHNYTETVFEKYASGGFEVSAEFSGCDNLTLTLENTFSYRGKDQKFLSEKRNRFLEFLKKNTILSKEMEEIQKYCLEHGVPEEMTEIGTLSFLFQTNQEKGKVTLRLIIEQGKNPNQSENWEITTRQ
ncbi:hypothetical protein [Fluviicola sp.]|uniref:hypothetical protein n=1 Tax=Fluviicola sp. TaxID=1917219 RepID=UPI00260BF435|nr:hypothetical protein [Fluviicola sp.]